jgi:hypothetical protein
MIEVAAVADKSNNIANCHQRCYMPDSDRGGIKRSYVLPLLPATFGG